MESERDDTLRLVTWNIRKGRGASGDGIDVDALAAGISERRPHLVLCQEVFHAADEAPLQIDELAEKLSMSQAYGPNAAYRRGNHGNATLTILPLLTAENHDLSTNRIERRGVLYTLLETPDSPLHVFNTHLGLNTVQRRKQVRRIAALLDERVPPGEPLVLAGDFNDWTGSLRRAVEERCRVTCALRGLSRAARRSWPSRAPVFGLDRVYLRHLEPESARIVRGEPFASLSDHLPVEVSLRPGS
jgi:endonuclease/exonuclease/phosphatase family metal-dependent hydrolase